MRGRRAALLSGAVLSLVLPVHVKALEPPPQGHVLRSANGHSTAVPVSPSLRLGEAFTIEGWLRLEASERTGFILGKGDPWTLAFLVGDGVMGACAVPSTASDFSAECLGGIPLPLHQWAHVALTLSDDTLRLYLDAQEVASRPFSGPVKEAEEPYQVARDLPGCLRQLRIWGRALGASELVTTSTTVLTGGEAGLRAYWPLDDGIGPSARDASPNANHLRTTGLLESWGIPPVWAAVAAMNAGPFFVREVQAIPVPEASLSGTLIDFDSDGDQDILAPAGTGTTEPGAPTYLYRNDGGGVFVDVTASHLRNGQLNIGPDPDHVGDFTEDGRLDVYVAEAGLDLPTNTGGQDKLLVGQPDGTLRDETAERLPQLRGWTHGSTFGDFDNDGSLDMFAVNIAHLPPMFYLNDGTGHFVASTAGLPPELLAATPYARCQAGGAIDFDLDGDLDIACGGSNGGSPRHYNRIMVNDGKGTFTFAPEETIPLPPSYGFEKDAFFAGTTFIRSADFNGDAWPDLVMTTLTSHPNLGTVVLYLNGANGTFHDATESLPPSLRYGTPAPAAYPRPHDVNGDGLIDLVMSGFSYPRLLLQCSDGRFQDATDALFALGGGANLLPVDLDGDGDSDLVNLGWDPPVTVYRNVKPFPEEIPCVPDRTTLCVSGLIVKLVQATAQGVDVVAPVATAVPAPGGFTVADLDGKAREVRLASPCGVPGDWQLVADGPVAATLTLAIVDPSTQHATTRTAVPTLAAPRCPSLGRRFARRSSDPAAASGAPPPQGYALRTGRSHWGAVEPAQPIVLGSEFTIQAWARLDSYDTWGEILGFTWPGDDKPSGLTSAGGDIRWTQFDPSGAGVVSQGDFWPQSLNTWRHYAVTRKNGTDRLYIDGHESWAWPSAPLPAAPPTTWFVGRSCDCVIAQASVWDRALSTAEINAARNGYLRGDEGGLLAYWPLDDGLGTVARDLSGHSRHLQLLDNPHGASAPAEWVRTSTVAAGPYFALAPLGSGLQEYFAFGGLLDLDADGDLDVVTHGFTWGAADGQPVRAFRNDGVAGFSEVTDSVVAMPKPTTATAAPTTSSRRRESAGQGVRAACSCRTRTERCTTRPPHACLRSSRRRSAPRPATSTATPTSTSSSPARRRVRRRRCTSTTAVGTSPSQALRSPSRFVLPPTSSRR